MDDEFSSNPALLLLGRPFMGIACTKIDVYEGTLSLEFDGEKVTFIVFDAMKYPDDFETIYVVDVIEPVVQEKFEEIGAKDELEYVVQHSKSEKNILVESNEEIKETIMSLHSLPELSGKAANSFFSLPVSHDRILPFME